jgi:3-oxoadipate enol-lactonase
VSDLAYAVAGEGPPFVWAHGLTSSRANEDRGGLFDWSPVVAGGRQVVRYDARGHGRSGGSPDPEAYRWPQLATDLLALLDELGIERAAAGGASMGCATLLHAAVRAPERFDRLVLVIPPTAWATRADQADQYEASARYVEARGKAAWMAAAEEAPRAAIFADLPPFPFTADIPEDLLPSVLRGAAASDLPPPRPSRCSRTPRSCWPGPATPATRSPPRRGWPSSCPPPSSTWPHGSATSSDGRRRSPPSSTRPNLAPAGDPGGT